ncbi:MAG: PIN domain-containing protein [Bacteroidetes bacterium]|jgi:predicted nucleic acid-binding protein|nr:PIN domain-containing protein [Bacteroidota bacterium]
MANSVLVDVNVCLDLLLDRHPFVEFSGQIFEQAEQNKLTIVVSGLSFDTLFYIMRPAMGTSKATQLLREFSRNVTIGTVNQSVVQHALQAGWNNLEDALQYYCAIEANCNTVVTRNVSDFTPARETIRVLTPEQFLSRL